MLAVVEAIAVAVGQRIGPDIERPQSSPGTNIVEQKPIIAYALSAPSVPTRGSNEAHSPVMHDERFWKAMIARTH